MSDPKDTLNDEPGAGAEEALAQLKEGLGRARRVLDHTRRTLAGGAGSDTSQEGGED